MWTISMLIAWVAVGVGEVGRVLHASPIERPNWGPSPSFATLALMTLIWPLIAIYASPLMREGTARGIVHGLMNAGIRFFAAALMIFAGLALAFHVAETTVWRTAVVIAEVITIPITLPLYGIVVGIVSVPVIIVVMGMLNLVFPVRSSHNS